jgi:hypothetical protein
VMRVPTRAKRHAIPTTVHDSARRVQVSPEAGMQRASMPIHLTHGH